MFWLLLCSLAFANEEVITLKKGDVATVVDHHPVSNGEEGYSLELFNALGDTIAVITVPESTIEPLTEDDIFSVRSLAVA